MGVRMQIQSQMKKAVLLGLVGMMVSGAALAGGRVDLAAGMYDVRHKERSAQIGAAWHGDPVFYGLHPMVGVTATRDRDAYVYAGGGYDWQFKERWRLTPSFAVGAYHRGDGKDLGGALEFRSSLALAYAFENGELGLDVNHVSNAGYYDRNPGAESVMLTWSVPLQCQKKN